MAMRPNGATISTSLRIVKECITSGCERDNTVCIGYSDIGHSDTVSSLLLTVTLNHISNGVTTVSNISRIAIDLLKSY